MSDNVRYGLASCTTCNAYYVVAKPHPAYFICDACRQVRGTRRA